VDLGSRDDWRPGGLEEDELFARGDVDLESGFGWRPGGF
jgi:hypothetical protein